MKDQTFGFFFETAGKSASQGAVSPAEQYFEGSLAEVSLVRETGQNSIDARAGSAPVIMEFELAEMETDLIPGIEGLRSHLEQVEFATRKAQGHDSMALALKTSQLKTLPVLRISDFGTTGLTGSESVDDTTSKLSALTRGAGVSANDGTRGGSFGIGSAVGPMASNMNTVLYTSRAQDAGETVFAGYSCLASHRDEEGIWRVGDGFYTDLNQVDFRYLRNPGAVGPFPVRKEPGTDVYILGYRKAGADTDLQHIKTAFMRNFFMAIDRGELIVRGIAATPWTLDKNSLKEYVDEDAEAQAYYRAIKDPEPIVKSSKRLGDLVLYVNVDDNLSKTLHTVTVRKPHMRIDIFRHTSSPVKYAAVLECSDDKANTLLRALEPPQHHEWDQGRAAHGPSVLKELKDFVREGLKSRVKQQIGDQVEIKGLARYLPTQIFDGETTKPGTGGAPVSGDGSEKESSTVHGNDGNEHDIEVKRRTTVRVGVQTSAESDGTESTTTGKDAGGGKKRRDKGGTLPGEGKPGEGSGRITSGDVRFRSWSDAATGDVCLALTPAEDIHGDLELVALGPGGSIETDYELPIAGVSLISSGVSTPLERDGNVLTRLRLKAGVTSHVRLKLKSTHRYRLGVK
jgi:hypothetical protein